MHGDSLTVVLLLIATFVVFVGIALLDAMNTPLNP